MPSKDPQAYNRAKMEANRLLIDELKLASGCVRCGYNDNPTALQFHHRDPATKEFTIGSGGTRLFSKLQLEIDKCDVLCANCHAIETWGR